MLINAPDTMRTVVDYDFHFFPAGFLGVTVDEKYGDKFIETDKTIVVSLGSRPSQVSGEGDLPEETVTINKDKVAYVATRKRIILERSKEQEEEWKKTLLEIAKGVH